MSINADGQINIVTPENVGLQITTAGLGSRSGAHIIDSLVLAAANVLLILAVQAVLVVGGSTITEAHEYLVAGIIIFLFFGNFGYFLLMEFYRDGQTIGKRVLGVRVVQDNGQPLTFLSAAIRTFFRIVDFLPFLYFLGILACFLHPRNKRIGDMVAGTILVVDPTRERLAARRGVDKEIEKLRPDLPRLDLREEMRQSVTREEWRMLAAFIERLPTLSPEKSREYGRQMADYFEQRLDLKTEGGQPGNRVAFLAALYLILKQDWGV
ncbi:MAG: RDD family protein [Firmicutes bacterium]|nr:RDD family protein [Bacillota bacterium]